MPAWITPLLCAVWWRPTSASRSSTAIPAPGRRCRSSRATARPTMPAPTTATSSSRGTTRPLAGLLARHAALEQLEVVIDHQPDQLLEARPGFPAELVARLRVVPYEV